MSTGHFQVWIILKRTVRAQTQTLGRKHFNTLRTVHTQVAHSGTAGWLSVVNFIFMSPSHYKFS